MSGLPRIYKLSGIFIARECAMRSILLLFFLLTANAFSQTDWKLAKNSDGIKVYTRTPEGSAIKEFKATVSIKASAVDVAQVVVDVQNYPEWYPDVMGAKVLEKVSKYEIIAYYRIDIPWPATDRDAVVTFKLHMDESKKNIKVYAKSKNNYKEEFYGVVRLKDADGVWSFKEHDGVTDVVYQMKADPGGNMPTWIINMFIEDGPHKTLKALRSRVE